MYTGGLCQGALHTPGSSHSILVSWQRPAWCFTVVGSGAILIHEQQLLVFCRNKLLSQVWSCSPSSSSSWLPRSLPLRHQEGDPVSLRQKSAHLSGRGEGPTPTLVLQEGFKNLKA